MNDRIAGFAAALALLTPVPTAGQDYPVAEAQALGVPAVVKRIAVMPERVRDGVTGFVAEDNEAFARHAVALLTDDALWRRQHEASLRLQQGWSWDGVASALEAELLAPIVGPNGAETASHGGTRAARAHALPDVRPRTHRH